jgi:hypothetical protein
MSVFTFPLFRSQFMSVLPVSEAVFDLGEAMQVDETAGGELLMASLGTRLWEGEVRLGKMGPAEWAQIEPMIDLLREPGRSFQCFDTRRPFPSSDPTGSVIAAASPVIGTVSGDFREISLTALPANYLLRRGDYLSFTYGSNPARRALHRIMESVTATAGGASGLFEVIPAVRPGWASGAAVELSRAWCKAVVLPGSVDKGSFRRGIAEGAGFRWKQSLRV